MVGITAVYVIATIYIWRANSKSAEATREQLEESKRQFRETQRLEVMPYLQFEDCDSTANYSLKLVLVSGDTEGGSYVLKARLKNIGHGTAKNITYIWNSLTASYDRGSFPIKALQAGDENFIKIHFAVPRNKPDNLKASFELSFSDLLENQYTQTIEFVFGYSGHQFCLKEHTTYQPNLIQSKNSAIEVKIYER